MSDNFETKLPYFISVTLPKGIYIAQVRITYITARTSIAAKSIGRRLLVKSLSATGMNAPLLIQVPTNRVCYMEKKIFC